MWGKLLAGEVFWKCYGFLAFAGLFLLPAYAFSFKLLMRDYCLGFGVTWGHNLVFWHSLPPASRMREGLRYISPWDVRTSKIGKDRQIGFRVCAVGRRL